MTHVGRTLLFLLVLLPGVARSDAAGEVRERFEQGNRLYGAEDFAGARDAYRAILDARVESASVYYNLGNAALKTGDIGEAVWAYRRAARLDPGDADIAANLAYARALTRDTLERGSTSALLDALSSVAARFPAGRAFSLALAAFWVFSAAVVAALRWPRTRRVARSVAWGAALIVVFVGSYGVYRRVVLDARDVGVVLASEVDVRSAPGDEGHSVFTLHAGTEVDVNREIGGWLEVSLGTDLKGWIPVDSLARI